MRRAAGALSLILASAIPAFSQEAQPPATPPAQVPQTAPTPAPQPAEPVTTTLGDFLVKAATHMKLPAPATGFTPESAAWALVQKGVRPRPELGSPLVEGDIVSMLSAMGYKVHTSTPSRVMTRERVDAILGVFFTPAS
ncbi:MAG: hypothetical protein ACREAA_13635 [Candidatus Polarisedimenticolia bacterium]